MSGRERLARLSSVRRLQELERQASTSQGGSGPLAFLQACLGCCGVCALICLSCVLILALSSTGIAKLAIGAMYLHDCEVAPMVPVFLLVGGLVPLLHGCTCRAEKDEGGKVKVACEGARCVIGLIVVLFELAWLIAMTVFVLRARAEVAALPAWCSDPSLRNASTPLPVSSTLLPTTTTTPPSTTTMSSSITTTPSSTTTAASTEGSSDTPTTTTSQAPSSSTGAATSSLSVTTRTPGEPTVQPFANPCKTCHPTLLTFAFAMVVLELVLVCVFLVAGMCVCCMYGLAVCTKD